MRVPVEDGYGYSIRRDYYSKLQSILLQVRGKLGEILLANGIPIPDLPFWGPRGDLDEFYLPIDFEILGICYRTEVERFLFTFDEHYNFQTDLPCNPDLQAPPPSPTPLPTPPPVHQGRRDPPPHMPDQSNPYSHSPEQINTTQASAHQEAPRTSSRSGWFMNDPIAARRRQSNIYHAEDGTARASRIQRNARGVTQAPTSRMREVLNNIGGTFENPPNSDHNGDQPASSASRANHGRYPGPPGDDPSNGDDDRGTGRNPRRSPREAGRTPRPPVPNRRNPNNGGPPGGDPDDGDDGGNGGNNGRGPRRGRNEPDRPNGQPRSQEPHFDLKLKFENVPRWDGNTDTIVRWISKVNNLARMSPTVFTQLGAIVLRRLEGTAETWYWSLPIDYRDTIERNWDTLRGCISSYYMNRKWLDKQKARAIRAYYRDQGHA